MEAIGWAVVHILQSFEKVVWDTMSCWVFLLAYYLKGRIYTRLRGIAIKTNWKWEQFVGNNFKYLQAYYHASACIIITPCLIDRSCLRFRFLVIKWSTCTYTKLNDYVRSFLALIRCHLYECFELNQAPAARACWFLHLLSLYYMECHVFTHCDRIKSSRIKVGS